MYDDVGFTYYFCTVKGMVPQFGKYAYCFVAEC